MPVNDCDRQVDRTGGVVPCGTGTPDKYAIVGFTSLQLDNVLRGDDPRAIGSPGTPAAQGTCSAEQLGLDTNGQRFMNNLAATCSGRPLIDSIPWDAAQSNNPAAPVSTTFKVYWKQGNNRTYYKGCDVGGTAPACDYVYNPTTFTLQWVNAANRNDGKTKLVDLQWNVNATPGTPGACGIRASDPNAICLVTQWLGYTDQNGTIGNGPSFGAQGHVLCDFDYNSCPAGAKP
jgi:hypothetical protein